MRSARQSVLWEGTMSDIGRRPYVPVGSGTEESVPNVHLLG